MSSNSASRLARLELAGTPYELGQQLGRFGAAAVHGYLVHSPAWSSVQQWRASPRALAMAQLIEQHYPSIYAELSGLAAGLELPLQEVLLWNMRGDLWALAPDGCTSVLMPGHDLIRLAHNEDGDPGLAGSCAIAQCSVSGGADFAAFVYPGSIPGHTLAVNNHGLALTVNNIRALTVAVGLPRMVLARALLDCTSVAQALQLVCQAPRAGAFHFSLADTSMALASLEFCSNYCTVLHPQQSLLHANHAIHAEARDWPQIISASSGRRQVRGNALIAQGEREPLRILADQGDAQYPILRRAADDVDGENTLASVAMHISSAQVRWQVYEHPLQPPKFTLQNGRFVEDQP